ncbi:MAG: acetoin utilization transport system ATP-binding protein [Phenylobacterium sp.]|jgi:acetoin utilization transport system ATP-binding protein
MQIELRHISHYRQQWAGQQLLLDDINLTIASGECVIISGRSGSGKSLLFSIVCGILAADSGDVLVDEKAIMTMTEVENQHYRRLLGVVFQVSALLSNLSLAENLMLPLNQHFPQRSQAQKTDEVEAIATAFGLSEFLNQRTDLLSTGQAALGGFVRALLTRPKCLVWDAPLSEIDLHWADLISAKLAEAKATGTTVILFTNRQSVLDPLADRRFCLEDGQLKENSHAL